MKHCRGPTCLGGCGSRALPRGPWQYPKTTAEGRQERIAWLYRHGG